jgi:hypothetical protein
VERLIVFEDRTPGKVPVNYVLRKANLPFEHHANPAKVVQAVLAGHPGALIWSIRPGSQADLATLVLIQAIAPEVPLLLIVPHQDQALRTGFADLRPVFVGRLPEGAALLLEFIEALDRVEAAAIPA